ncbi:sensor histidine kinase inhibitor, KipI family [Streptomyces sp. yr375]|uniref:5-oxoprolinase subunit B family protein n=1 Tax=Streptomyces sp. yr375 TaxID=1761906 RepID=UPI0008B78EB1|nr:carboxyltransferase domain-containing protein [Streptomyces sp. yr375]SEP96510.1 sensor histidine kinase inhibitor, KipI family [Streptomyces sp. yr375]
MTTAPYGAVTVEPFGDSAVMVTIPHTDQAVRRAGIVAFRDRFLANRPHGVLDVVSGLESLLIEFDPLQTALPHVEYAARLVARWAPSPSDGPAGSAGSRAVRAFAIPVVFDDEDGPDLASVAEETGLTSAEVVEAIAGSTFTIALLGAAMAPMMDGLKLPRPVRRRAEPRTDVAPGAIMIAGTNAIIQPFPGPTGWRVVGRTPHTIVDISRPDPVSFGTGDTVRFVPVSRAEAAALDAGFLLPTEESV